MIIVANFAISFDNQQETIFFPITANVLKFIMSDKNYKYFRL